MELVIQSELLLTRAWVKVSELACSIAVAFSMGRAYVLMLFETAFTFTFQQIQLCSRIREPPHAAAPQIAHGIVGRYQICIGATMVGKDCL